MSRLPSVTCVMAAFNYERYIASAIESVLTQDYPPELLDLVVVNDGSTDNTAAVVRDRIPDAGGRLKFIEQPNGGQVAATRAALEHVTGELIAMCDADDEWLPGKIRAQAELFVADPDVTLCYGDMRVIDADGVVLKPSFITDMNLEFREGHVLEHLLEQDFVPEPTMVVRTSTVRPYPARLPNQDYWLVSCAAAAGRAAAVRTPIANYRLHGSNQGFGTSGDAHVRRLMRELLARRLIISELFGAVSPDALVQVVDNMIKKAIWVSTLGTRSVQQVLDIQPDEEARARAELHRGRQETERDERLRAFVHALALDPFNVETRTAVLDELSGAIQTARAQVPAPSTATERTDVPEASGSIHVLAGDQPLASVIIPAFNHARFLPAAIDSVLAQQLHSGPLEVIVVDDGSTNETPAVLAGYADRVRAIHQPNGGINAPVNTGLGLARGRYVAILDADDTWPSDRLARHIRVLESNPEVGLVHGDMTLTDEQGHVTEPSFFASRGLAPPEGRVLGELLAGNFVSGGASTFRADLIPAMHPIDAASVYPDWWIATCVAAVAEIRLVPGIANHYRRHGHNNSLGREGAEEQVHVQRQELPWRRWMFQNMLGDETITAEHIRTALGSFRFGMIAAGLAAQTGVRGILEPDPEAAARILCALPPAGPGAQRSRRLLEALAHDPFDGAIGLDLEIALQRELQSEATPAGSPLIALPSRGAICVAWLPEVVRHPELLRSFAADLTDRQNTTVAILAPAGTSLEPLIAIFDADPTLSGEECDFVVVSEPTTPPARALLAARASSRLTLTASPEPFDGLPLHRSGERLAVTT